MLQNKDQSLLLITPSMRANIHRPRQVTKSSSKVVSIEMQVNFMPPGDLVHVFKSVHVKDKRQDIHTLHHLHLLVAF